LLQLIPVIWGSGTLVFFLINAVPGDPVDHMLGESAQPASKDALRASLHLDQPLTTQYALFWNGAFTGDLGFSFISRRPVSELILERLPGTAALALLALFAAVLLSVPLGVLAAAHQDHWLDPFLL